MKVAASTLEARVEVAVEVKLTVGGAVETVAFSAPLTRRESRES